MEASTNNNDQYNADELEAPKWLSAQFFTEVLSQHEKAPELKVTDVKISPASAKGDHYASIMFRCNISYTTSKGEFSKSLILKTMPDGDCHKNDMLGDSYIFETEIGMYTKVLPKFEKILREVGDETRLYTPCLYHSLNPRKVMIFEDLVPQGYTVIRDRDATMEELKAAYAKLAKWHAISFKIVKEQPEYLKEFKHGVCDIPNFMENPFMTGGMSSFIAMLEKTPEISKYIPHFKKMENDYLDRLKVVLMEYRDNPRPDGYYILCHGDFHLRNMMFKHNPTSGALEDCMLLDFQACNVCPITVDLIYSNYALLGVQDRKDNYKEYLNCYFSVFVETLKKIGYQGELPNSTDFWKQLSQHKAYDIFLITTLLPMRYATMENLIDIGEIMQNADARRKLYFLKNFLDEAKYLLPRLEKLEYLE